MRNISLILAAGSGTRFGADKPKQFSSLLGKEMIAYSVNALQKSDRCDKVLIVCPAQQQNDLTEKYGVHCIPGGSSRNQSLYRGLCYIQETFPTCENIFIQEAARPMITAELVDYYFERLSIYDGVITTAHLSDSLGKEGQHVTLRDEYYLIQAPEAFRFHLLLSHFNPDSPITATVQQMPEGSKILRFFDFLENIKVTYPHDMQVAEYLLRHREEPHEATCI